MARILRIITLYPQIGGGDERLATIISWVKMDVRNPWNLFPGDQSAPRSTSKRFHSDFEPSKRGGCPVYSVLERHHCPRICEGSRKTEIRTTHRKAWIPMHDNIHRSREFTADASDLPLHQWNAVAHFSARFYRASPWSSVTKVELENG